MTDTALAVTVNATEVDVSPSTTLVVGVTDGGSTILETAHALDIVSQAVLTIDLGAPGAGAGDSDPAGTAAALVAAHEAAADPHGQYTTQAEGDARWLLQASFTWANLGGKPATFAGLGVSLGAGDIPPLDWSKITSGRPTTLAGYGITDAVANAAFTWANLGGKPGTFAALGVTLAAADVPSLDWAKIATGKPSTLAGYGITDAAAATHAHTWASLTGKPTTVAGFGITDAVDVASVPGLVRGATLTGLSLASGVAVNAGDTVLQAFGKLQSQVATLNGVGYSWARDAVSATLNLSTGAGATLPAADNATAGVMSAGQAAKLSGIAAGATANATDAQLRDRSTHTGSQVAATISDFVASVRSAVLTGISTATAAVVGATDTVLSAIGKLQAQISSLPALSDGTYTPVMTGVTNIASIGAVPNAQFLRVGNTVTVSGRATFTPTAANQPTEVAISLPIASNFATGLSNTCNGVGASENASDQMVAYILPDDANDRARLLFYAKANTAKFWAFHFTYRIA